MIRRPKSRLSGVLLMWPKTECFLMFYSPHGWGWIVGNRIAIPRDRIYASTLRQGVRQMSLWMNLHLVPRRPGVVQRFKQAGGLAMQDTYWMTDFGKQVKFRLHEADPTFSSRLKVVDLVTGQDEVVFP